VRRYMHPMEAYALWSETYDSDPNPLLALEERTLIPILPDFRGSFVLDLACGTGRWLETLLALGARRGIGIDLSFEMLAQARRKLKVRRNLIRSDCTAIPVSSGTIDMAICSFGAGYIEDLQAVASELSRVLSKGGYLILTDLHPSSLERGWRRTFRHGDEVIEIISLKASIEHVIRTFQEHRFKLEQIICPCFGEPERPIFKKCGKEHLFEQAQAGPAIFICAFYLRGSCTSANR
jgi:ubiquinone/menaquinone biosynthesis C-methylase UbiE